ncbi:MAG: ParA family protein [Nitrososphaerota archaeon]|jgi:chromosome partitioning protein|nr:ParA family protein [Nitrososphaerota archaeon]
MKCKKIAFMNSKGGVGKSTSVFQVSGVLSTMGEKVLIIDLDKQCDISYTMLRESPIEDIGFTMFDFMKGMVSPEDVVKKTYLRTRSKPEYLNIDVMPADVRFEHQELLTEVDIKDSLNKFIEENNYTWVLVDMPPSNKMINEICFSQIVNYIVVPFSTDYSSVRAYGSLIETWEKAKENNPDLHFLGVYLAKHSQHVAIHRQIKEKMSSFRDMYLDVCIPDKIEIQESYTYLKPISYYRKYSSSKKAYEELVKALKKKIELYDY